jgi:hypothetical protein
LVKTIPARALYHRPSLRTKPMPLRPLCILGFALVLFCQNARLAHAQINPSPVFGTSTAGGSGGTPTGPTNPGALGFGTSSAAGSGGIPTGPLNPNAYGYGTSTAAGSGGIATGPTVPGWQQIPPGLRIMTDPYGRYPVYVRSARKAPVGRSVKGRHQRVVYRNR